MEELEVQIRVPFDHDAEWLGQQDEMVEAFGEALESRELGFIDDSEEEGDEICFYLYGPSQDALVGAADPVLDRYGLRAGAYAVKTTPGVEDSGEGERVSL